MSTFPQEKSLPRLARCCALLALEGGAAAMFLQDGIRRGWLAAFVARNELPTDARTRLLVTVVLGALLPCVVAGALLLRRGAAVLPRLEIFVRRMSLVLVLWAFPPLLTWQAWDGRDLAFLATAAAIVIATEWAARVTLTALGDPAPWLRRLSGRLPALAPHLVVMAAVGAYVGYFSHYTVLQHHRVVTSGFDLGYFDSLFWNAMHGHPFYAPLAHPPDSSYLSIHAEFALYPLLPFYMLFPRAETLLVMQSALLGLSAVPLYLFARRRLGNDWLAALVALCFLLYPALHGPNFCDFHFLTISVFFVLWAVYLFEAGRPVLFWIAALLCLLCREDVPFGVIACGVALALSGRAVRTGVALTALAVVYVLVVKFVIMAHYGTSFLYIYQGLVPPGESGFSGVVKTLVTNPLFTFASLLTFPKLIFVLQVFVPLAFLPLRRRRYWFLLFGGFFVTLLSTGYRPITSIGFQYVTHFTPYVFVAATLVLQRLATDAGRPAQLAAALAMAAGTVVLTSQYGALRQEHFFSGDRKIEFQQTPIEREYLQSLRQIAETIPPDATVSATENDGPHLAHRHRLYTLKYDVRDAEYLVYSYHDLPVGNARQLVSDALRAGTFGFHAERGDYVVLRKGAPTDRNQELLAKIR
jgi:uncharacterized membrane protein